MAFLARMVIFALVLSSVFPAFAGKRVAIVIGNSTYTTISALVNLRNDARAVDKAFREIGFDDVRLLENLDQGGMLRAL